MRKKYVLLYWKGEDIEKQANYADERLMPMQDTFSSPAEDYFESQQFKDDKDFKGTEWDVLEVHDIKNKSTYYYYKNDVY